MDSVLFDSIGTSLRTAQTHQSTNFNIGNFSCSTSDPRCVPAAKRKPLFSKVFEKGKRYLLRLINSSAESDFIFSIDNHELEVISNDLVAIKPFKTDSIHIGIGQRYSVVVQANPSPVQQDGNYWIRTQTSDRCGNISNGAYDHRTGIIRYNAKSTTLPTSTGPTDLNTACEDIPTASLVPVVPWQVDRHAVNNVVKDTFIADIDNVEEHGYFRWDLTNNPLW